MTEWLRVFGFGFVFFLAGELTCRIEEWIRFRTPLLSRYTSQTDLLIRDQHGAHGRPNAQFQKWRMNQLGMRGPTADSLKPAGTIRVVVAGASEAFGVYETENREFPRQLEDSLQRLVASGRCDPAIRRFEVLNSAFRGMSLPTVEQDLRLRIAAFDPDVVLYYPTPPQYLEQDTPTPAVPDTTAVNEVLHPLRVLLPRFLTRFREEAGRMVPNGVREWRQQKAMTAAIHRRPAGWRFEDLPQDRLAAYDRDLRSLVATVRQIGAVPLLATHANAFPEGGQWNRRFLLAWERFYPRAPAPVIVEFDAAARSRTLAVAQDSAVSVVDLASALHQQSDSLFADFSHFTDSGSGFVAGLLVPGVIKSLTQAGLPGCR